MPEDTIKARIVFDTSGIAGPMGSAGKRVTSSTGGTSKDISKIAAGVIIGAGALAIIKKSMGSLMKASPKLQQTLSIFSKSMMLILRPIGDLLSVIFRPLALLLLKYAIPFYKMSVTKLKTTGGKVGGAVGGAVGIIGGTIAASAIAGSIAGPVGTALGVIAGVFLAGLGVLLGINFGAMIEEWSKSIYSFFKSIDWVELWQGLIIFFTETLPEITQVAWDMIATFFLETLPFAAGYAFETILELFNDVWEAIKKFIVVTLPEAVIEAWEKLKEFIVSIPTKIETAFEAVKIFFTKTIPGWFTSAIDMIKKKWDSIKSFGKSLKDKASSAVSKISSSFSGGRKSVRDAIITPKGDIITTDPKDYLIATKNPQSLAGGSTTINISVNALDASSFDRNVLDKIARAVDEVMKRGLSGRTTESIGI